MQWHMQWRMQWRMKCSSGEYLRADCQACRDREAWLHWEDKELLKDHRDVPLRHVLEEGRQA